MEEQIDSDKLRYPRSFAMLSVACLARRRRMHCRGSDAAAAGTTAPAPEGRRAAGTQQGRPRLPQGDAGSARRERRQTVRAGHAPPAPGPRRQQRRRRTGSSPAAAVASAAATDAGEDRGDVEEEEDGASAAPSSESEASAVLCAVCLEEVRCRRRAAAAEAEAITLLPCSHAYHPGCVLPWLAAHRACPCCRATVPSSPEN